MKSIVRLDVVVQRRNSSCIRILFHFLPYVSIPLKLAVLDLAIISTTSTMSIKAASQMEEKSELSPLPEVLELHYSNATKDQVVDALKVAGGVFIRGLLTPEQTRQIERDAGPWLEKDKPWNGKELQLPSISHVNTPKGDFFPPETRRAYGLMGKSKCFAEAIVGNRLWVEVCDELLTSYNKHNWVTTVHCLTTQLSMQ